MPRRWQVQVGVRVSWWGRWGQEGFIVEEGERVIDLMAVAAMDSKRESGSEWICGLEKKIGWVGEEDWREEEVDCFLRDWIEDDFVGEMGAEIEFNDPTTTIGWIWWLCVCSFPDSFASASSKNYGYPCFQSFWSWHCYIKNQWLMPNQWPKAH